MMRPSRSSKLIGESGCFGSMRTTEESTLGGGTEVIPVNFQEVGDMGQDLHVDREAAIKVITRLSDKAHCKLHLIHNNSRTKKGRCTSSLKVRGDGF
jgi:hypothetical protein